MTRITIADPLADQLQTVSQPVELCDDAGRVLGQFLPALNPSQYEPCEPPIIADCDWV